MLFNYRLASEHRDSNFNTKRIHGHNCVNLATDSTTNHNSRISVTLIDSNLAGVAFFETSIEASVLINIKNWRIIG